MGSFIVDDANDPDAQGGVQTLIIGQYGTGKSSLMVQMAQKSQYVVKGSKKRYIHNLINGLPTTQYNCRSTTAIWRIRDADLWASMLPGNWKYPGGKKCRVFIHKGDIGRVTPFVMDGNRKPIAVPNLDEIWTYDTSDDLVDHLLIGGINLVVEPQEYRLSANLCDVLLKARAEYVGKAVDERTRDDLEDTPARVRGRGRPLKKKDYSLYAVKPAVWWFDMFNSLMTRWGGLPVIILSDESDDYLAQLASDSHFWLISQWTSWARDFRKLNISMVNSCHGWGLLHDLIYKRSNIKLLMRGTKKSENTQIHYTRMFSQLQTGSMIAEQTNVDFGIAVFGKLSGTVTVRIDGLSGSSRFFDEVTAKEISSHYHIHRPEDTKSAEATTPGPVENLNMKEFVVSEEEEKEE